LIIDLESKTQIMFALGRMARNVEGPPGVPSAALPYETCACTLLVWGASVGTRILAHRDQTRAGPV
jgi:hypothetical protein